MLKRLMTLANALLFTAALYSGGALRADDAWPPRAWLVNSLVKAVPAMLDSFDPDSGRFNSSQWTCQQQHAIFPLAAAWACQDQNNPFYHDPQLLVVIGKGGDALCDVQDDLGRLPHSRPSRDQNHSSYIPWTFSRWIRSYLLVKDQLPPEQRERWQQGLNRAFSEIHQLCAAPEQPLHPHLAAALFVAGQALNQPDWQADARQFMAQLAGKQTADGFWVGHWGPSMSHNNSLLEAIGIYYALSKDQLLAETLQRGAQFHTAITWPDGTSVAVIDDRQSYQPIKNIGNVGFSWSTTGRAFLNQQLQPLVAANQSVSADYAATMLVFGGTGTGTQQSAETAGKDVYSSGDGLFQIHHQAPWRFCLSAYTAPPANQRWLLDRQNMLDLYHDDLGMVLGGGNGKNQPLWSSFAFTKQDHALSDNDASNDASSLPTAAKISRVDASPALILNYRKNQCRLSAQTQPDGAMLLQYALITPGDHSPASAQLPFLKRRGPLYLGNNNMVRLSDQPLRLSGQDAGGYFVWGGLRVDFPAQATLHWPVFGRPPTAETAATTTLSQARLVLSIPLDQQSPAVTIRLQQVPEAIPGLISHPTGQCHSFSPSATPARFLHDLQALFLGATRPGESITLTIPNIKAGRYEVFVEFILNPNYGIAQVSVNQQQLGQVFDAYAPAPDCSGLVPFGVIDLPAGNSLVNVCARAKNPRASGMFLALQAVHLRPAPPLASELNQQQPQTEKKP